MRTIRTKIYKFKELNEKAKAKAISIEIDNRLEGDLILIDFSDYCTEKAEKEGFENIELKYSLNYSQGDGLSFSGFVNLEKIIPEIIPNIKKSVLDIIINNCISELRGNTGRYYFARPSDYNLWLRSYETYSNLEDFIDQIRGLISSKYVKLCKELEEYGYKQIDNETSEETIVEILSESDREFYIDGKHF